MNGVDESAATAKNALPSRRTERCSAPRTSTRLSGPKRITLPSASWVVDVSDGPVEIASNGCRKVLTTTTPAAMATAAAAAHAKLSRHRGLVRRACGRSGITCALRRSASPVMRSSGDGDETMAASALSSPSSHTRANSWKARSFSGPARRQASSRPLSRSPAAPCSTRTIRSSTTISSAIAIQYTIGGWGATNCGCDWCRVLGVLGSSGRRPCLRPFGGDRALRCGVSRLHADWRGRLTVTGADR